MVNRDFFSQPANRNKAILWTSMVLFCGLIIWLIISNYVPTGSVKLNVALFPSDSVLTIDGKKFRNNQTAILKLGDHEISVESNGFESYDDKLIVNQDDKYVVYILEPQTTEAEQWVSDHQDEYNIVYGKAEEQNGIDSATYSDSNPILDVLPYDGGAYTIGTLIGVDPIVVSVDAGAGYRNAAIKQIYGLGFDPASYNIEFEDYTNPFKESK